MKFQSASSRRSVFAPVIALYFNKQQEEECRAFLQNRVAHSECVPIVDENQLLMSGDGRLRETGYRFNPIGFEALARALSSGLAAMFNQLSGESARAIDLANNWEADVAAAASIYNTTLRTRFEFLRERTLLLNHQAQAVEGFLGLDHKMLDNVKFFDIVSAALRDKQTSAAFCRAEVIGRELRLYFIDNNSTRSDIHPDARHTFASGWYFANREDTGKALKAACCIYTKFGVAYDKLTRYNKVVHVGADIVGRTTTLVDSIASQNVDMAAVATQVRKLLATPMGFSTDKSQHYKSMNFWAGYMRKLGVTFEAAVDQCVQNSAAVGSDLEMRDPLEIYSHKALTSRTAYDLVCSILRMAKSEYGHTKDFLHGAAMQLLAPERTKNVKSRPRENRGNKDE